MTLKPLARPDRRMISPTAAPVAYSVVRHLIYTSRLAGTQGWSSNVLAKAEFHVTIAEAKGRGMEGET
jgi:hypothetical protein